MSRDLSGVSQLGCRRSDIGALPGNGYAHLLPVLERTLPSPRPGLIQTHRALYLIDKRGSGPGWSPRFLAISDYGAFSGEAPCLGADVLAGRQASGGNWGKRGMRENERGGEERE